MEINDSATALEPAKKERNLRDEYFAEKKRIVEQLGDLDQIRSTLGLNRRQMCRLLLVDPSAWTRWVRTGAPPHIYQALRWLLELRGIRPDVIGPANFSTRLDEIQSSMQSKILDLERHIQMLERTLALTRVVVERENDNRTRRTLRPKIKKARRKPARVKAKLTKSRRHKRKPVAKKRRANQKLDKKSVRRRRKR